MTRVPVLPLTMALLAAATISCSNAADTPAMKEVQRVHSGDLDVVLLSNDGTLSHGKDAVTIEFRKGDTLVDVGEVKVGAAMVMAGMAPMLGSVFLEKGDTPGRYTADTDLSMSGGWQLKIDWDGPAGRGSASMSATAQ